MLRQLRLTRMDAITDALKTVIDPDIGINIVDLGLVETVDDSAEPVTIGLVMTSPACPQAGYIADQCGEVLAALGIRAEISVLDDPPWQPGRMSATARAALGWDE
ncbi:MAG TPA: metal-sulfur cluster assembly factor [Candidatus Omnitrophota bacterium]|nr:metal-sulfur cluster assembly factor [Candidatus Omnitrophota bacterium]